MWREKETEILGAVIKKFKAPVEENQEDVPRQWSKIADEFNRLIGEEGTKRTGR
jgi:hypothetical protein